LEQTAASSKQRARTSHPIQLRVTEGTLGEPERLALHTTPMDERRATLSGSPNRPAGTVATSSRSMNENRGAAMRAPRLTTTLDQSMRSRTFAACHQKGGFWLCEP